jgi:hypothetical protein
MIQCSLSRFTAWPGPPTAKRKSGTFQVDYITLLDDLSSELGRIGAKNVEIGLHIDETRVRTARRAFDGWPKSDVAVLSPGVILRFDRRDKPMQFACDHYLFWQHNLRGISLTLEALRAIARHGASQGNEQYRGYERQIAASSPSSEVEEQIKAAKWIAAYAGRPGDWSDIREASSRIIKSDGPDSATLRELNAAADILKRRHRA